MLSNRVKPQLIIMPFPAHRNLVSFVDGGIHVQKKLQLQSAGNYFIFEKPISLGTFKFILFISFSEKHCCQTLRIELANDMGNAKQRKMAGIYNLITSTKSTLFWAYKHENQQLEIFRR